jgi:Ca2+-binding RTX toxin-like protein
MMLAPCLAAIGIMVMNAPVGNAVGSQCFGQNVDGDNPGTNGPDQGLIGDPVADVWALGDETDTTEMRDGNDRVCGESHVDGLEGQGGVDRIDGGNHGDLLFGDAQGDIIFGAGVADRVQGDGAGDELHGEDGEDNVLGVDGPDLIFGDEDDDEIWDGEGGDDLHGNGGNQDVWKRCNDLTFDAADGIEVMLGPDLDYC